MLKSPPVVALARPRFKFDPKRVREVLNKIETDVEVATEAALERGIYAALRFHRVRWWPSARTSA